MSSMIKGGYNGIHFVAIKELSEKIDFGKT
jgi:hypothetical protein